MAVAGFSHVNLTVSDLDRSRAWYARAVGWTELMAARTDTTTYAVGQVPGGAILVLRTHDEPAADAFDPRRVGLDHVSFAVASVADLSELEQTLQSMGATVSPIEQTPTAHVLSFRDCDGIALEAYLPL
ncbi:MAG TPA: VOC family protein [Mycobacteriales bacterium]